MERLSFNNVPSGWDEFDLHIAGSQGNKEAGMSVFGFSMAIGGRYAQGLLARPAGSQLQTTV